MKLEKCKRCNGTGLETDPLRLVALRKARDITQKDMAVKLKISATYLSDLENGRRDWNTALIEKFNSVVGK